MWPSPQSRAALPRVLRFPGREAEPSAADFYFGKISICEIQLAAAARRRSYGVGFANTPDRNSTDLVAAAIRAASTGRTADRARPMVHQVRKFAMAPSTRDPTPAFRDSQTHPHLSEIAL
jgi:hypothetical protein